MKLRERKKAESNVELPRKASRNKVNPIPSKINKPNTRNKASIERSGDEDVQIPKKKNDKLAKIKTSAKNTDRVTRSKIPIAVSPSKRMEKPIQSKRERKIGELKKNVEDKAKNKNKKETNANQITNYFKKDTTPKEQRLDQSLLNGSSSGKKACWANASLILSKSQSKPNADPYEFVDDLPKAKRKAKRRAATRSTPYTKFRKLTVKGSTGKFNQLTNHGEEPKEPILNSTLAEKDKITNEKSSTLPSLHQLEISGITVTNRSSLHNCDKITEKHMVTNNRDVLMDEKDEITPTKTDKQSDSSEQFKTPALPVKPMDKNYDFFAKATAISTPKITATNSKPLTDVASETNSDVEKSKVVDKENYLPPSVDVSPINDNVPKSSSEGKFSYEEIADFVDDEMDFCPENEKNLHILSGSFVESDIGVYENENFKRSSTPELVDDSIILSNSNRAMNSENELVLRSPDTSCHRDAFSLYGSPVKMSPVKRNDCDDESNRSKMFLKKLNKPTKDNMKNRKPLTNQSDNQTVKPVRKTYGKKEVKAKKEDPSDAAFDKWLRDMTNEFEEVQKFELVVE